MKPFLISLKIYCLLKVRDKGIIEWLRLKKDNFHQCDFFLIIDGKQL